MLLEKFEYLITLSTKLSLYIYENTEFKMNELNEVLTQVKDDQALSLYFQSEE